MNDFAIYYVACYAVFLVVYARAAFTTKRTLEIRSRFTSGRLVLAVIVLGFIVLRRTDVIPNDVDLWHDGVAVDLAAMTLSTLGLAIMLWSRYALGANWSAAVTFKQDHELVQSGPYALARHPIYTGLINLVIGGVVIHGGVCFWVPSSSGSTSRRARRSR